MRVTESETATDVSVVRSGWLSAIAVFMIGLGIIAILFPFIATVTSTLVFGWVFIIAGIAQIVYAIQSKGFGQIVWKLILGLLYLVAGIFVLANPLEGVLAFTLVLGITIFAQGIIQVSMALQTRRVSPNWGWMLVSGIAGIILGIYIWSNVPASATWLLGTLIGINLLFDGTWMLTLHSGQRSTLAHSTESTLHYTQENTMDTTPQPVIADQKPVVMELEPGTYYWCSCGRSGNQPFCNGAHKGTGFVPMSFKVTEKKTVALCACKHTGNVPFCDGSHAKL